MESIRENNIVQSNIKNTEKICDLKLLELTDKNKLNLSANYIFDLINKAELFCDQKIDIIICSESIWFKGKDIANILGYKNTKKSIIDHVKEKNKTPLKNLYNRGNDLDFLTNNQKNTIYINEAGLYQLIMKSKLKIAEQFQDWITDELLPKIRKISQYKYLQQLEEKDKYIEQKEKEYNRLHHINAELLTYKKLSEKNESVYLVSTYNYITKGLIKVGRTKNIKARNSGHNTSHPTGDKVKILHEFKVNDSVLMESVIHKKLNGLRPDKKSEFFMCPYDLLFDIVDMIIQFDDEENESVNKLIDAVFKLKQKEFKYLDWTSGFDMSIFEDNMKLIENITDNDGNEVEVKHAEFNITTANQKQKDAFIRDCMLAYQKNILIPQKLTILAWSVFQSHLIKKLNIPKSKFKALEWRQSFKEIAENEEISIKIKGK